MILAILMILAGAILSLFERYLSASKKDDFTFNVFWGKNLPLAFFNLIMGVVLVIAIMNDNADFKIVADKWDATLIFWIAVGSLGHYIYKLIIGLFTLLIKKFADKFTELKPRD